MGFHFFGVSKKAVICLAGLFMGGFASAQKHFLDLGSTAASGTWKLKPQSEVGKDSVRMYDENYTVSDWVPATVPGAVFTSYVNAGLEKDPNFGDNIYHVDKAKYDRNFWYRTEFSIPVKQDERLWLNFEGVNRKADVFFNGIRLGTLDGFMNRGKYEITDLVKKQGKNVLAVLVYWPTRPVANHASPTYISSDSWDWMPAVPGLLQGITDDVYISTSGDVTLIDPWVRTDVPSKDKGIVSLSVQLKNNSAKDQEGTLEGTINPGNIQFARKIKLQPGQSVQQFFDTSGIKELLIKDPALWWPNGYGSPSLYTMNIRFTADGKVSDSKEIRFGIKKYSYDTIGGDLHIRINGEPVYVKGGDWGMSEYLLRCRGDEYDLKLKLHQAMNFNMVRNWIGSITDEEFYDACDRYGIMVWDDFWLNSHPNLPDDVMAFNLNAVEKIKRLRNHPSIAVWCGDNEGYPLPPLNGWLAEDVKTFDAADRHYHANSHSDALTGSGPWRNFHPNWYFTKYPGGFGGDPGWGFRTEIGTAVFTNFESFKKFMPESSWWPRNEMWNKHFFGKSAENAGPDIYFNTVNENYGTAKGIEDFCRKAQLVNIEVNKALYEGWQHHMWNDASGVMTWMSQSAYPSFVWQTYDYYYDLNGAFWGVKKACEPVHIQWSYADNSVKVINTTLNNFKNVTAEAIIYNLDGKPVARYHQAAVMNAGANAATSAFSLNFATDNLAFQKRTLASSVSKDAGDADAITDGSSGSRWSSDYSDDQWVYVDLGHPEEVTTVRLAWETAYAKAYKLQVSADGSNWKDVYETTSGKGGNEEIRLTPVTTRYIRMKGLQRATQFGYSLYEIEVYGTSMPKQDLTPVHFIRLYLKDEKGNLLSDNFYWRSIRTGDYTALNSLTKASLQVNSRTEKKNGKVWILATIKNNNDAPAFAIRVQALNAADGSQILPVIMNENYFTLFRGESKSLKIEFDESLLKNGKYRLQVDPYNNK